MTGELTDRQKEILVLYARGRSTHAIACLLEMVSGTVLNTSKRIEGVLGAQNRTHAVVLAIRKGIITMDDIYPPRMISGD